jgi:hypothetical protein
MKRFIKLSLISFVILWTSIASAQLSSIAFTQAYTCDGNTAGYTFTFPIYAAYDANVTVNTAGTVTTLNSITQYTMAPSSYFPYSFSSGGTITLSAGALCPNQSILTITRATPQTQLSVYSNNSTFDQTILESDLNKVYMVIQEIAPATSTFTPAVTLGGGSTGLTYTSRSGYYTKTGNRVYFDISIVLSAVGSSTGVVIITGLPYTSITNSVVNIMPQNITFSGQYGGYVSGSTIVLYNVSTAGVLAGLTNSNLSNSSQIKISGVYETAN